MTSLLLLALFALLGIVFGWIAFFQTRHLRGEVTRLRQRVSQLEQGNAVPASSAEPGVAASVPQQASTPVTPAQASTPVTPAQAGAQRLPASTKPRTPPRWLVALREQWMSWLGGTCIGLAGIFLVRYSIDQGLLGPGARITLGLLGGFALHGAAFWLRRHKGSHDSLAALAAGGSITLFAAILAGLHLHAFFSPGLAFALLAPVALLTMALALWHGPLLAALGLLGAYALPLLVGGNSDTVALVLAYILLITATGLWLLRHVERTWLWTILHLGTGLWWLLTLGADSADGLRGWYLALWAWLLFALPGDDWLLQRRQPLENSGWRQYASWPPGRDRQQVLGLMLALGAWACSIFTHAFGRGDFVEWSPFALLLFWLAGRRPRLLGLAWLLAPLCWGAWWLQSWITAPPVPELLPAFYWYCLGSAALLVALAWYNARQGHANAWKPLALLPLGFLVLAWSLSPHMANSAQWPLFACLLAAGYLALATVTLRRAPQQPLVGACFFIGAHLGYAVAVAFSLDQASLTLALALQLLSLAWLIRRFQLPVLGWVFKGLVALVLIRLSLNPWLLQYPDIIHWSLWTYGGAALCCWGATRVLQDTQPTLKAWGEGAALHLFTLFVWTELRWWLHDGAVFAPGWSALEAGLDCAVFGTLGLVYHWRERFSAHLYRLYRVYSVILLFLAGLCYLALLQALLLSLPWLTTAVGSTWFFNSLWLLFGMPALLAAAIAHCYLPVVRRPARWLAVGAGFIFVCVQIRHFWQGSVSLELATGPAELYTYSAVWLLLAVAAVLAGAWRLGNSYYRGGMALLLLVVAKLFLVDMAGLTGLLRVASFLGMGLALLAIAWLHRQLQGAAQNDQPMESGA